MVPFISAPSGHPYPVTTVQNPDGSVTTHYTLNHGSDFPMFPVPHGPVSYGLHPSLMADAWPVPYPGAYSSFHTGIDDGSGNGLFAGAYHGYYGNPSYSGVPMFLNPAEFFAGTRFADALFGARGYSTPGAPNPLTAEQLNRMERTLGVLPGSLSSQADQLRALEALLGRRFDATGGRLNDIEGRFAGRFDDLECLLNPINDRFNNIDNLLGPIAGRFNGIDRLLNPIAGNFTRTFGRFDQLEALLNRRFNRTLQRFNQIDRTLAGLPGTIQANQARQTPGLVANTQQFNSTMEGLKTALTGGNNIDTKNEIINKINSLSNVLTRFGNDKDTKLDLFDAAFAGSRPATTNRTDDRKAAVKEFIQKIITKASFMGQEWQDEITAALENLLKKLFNRDASYGRVNETDRGDAQKMLDHYWQ